MATKAMARVMTNRPAIATAGPTEGRPDSARAPSGGASAAGNVDLTGSVEFPDQPLQAAAQDHLLAAQATHPRETVIGARERAGGRHFELGQPNGAAGMALGILTCLDLYEASLRKPEPYQRRVIEADMGRIPPELALQCWKT